MCIFGLLVRVYAWIAAPFVLIKLGRVRYCHMRITCFVDLSAGQKARYIFTVDRNLTGKNRTKLEAEKTIELLDHHSKSEKDRTMLAARLAATEQVSDTKTYSPVYCTIYHTMRGNIYSPLRWSIYISA
jgi:hypothetical protein